MCLHLYKHKCTSQVFECVNIYQQLSLTKFCIQHIGGNDTKEQVVPLFSFCMYTIREIMNVLDRHCLGFAGLCFLLFVHIITNVV